MDLKRLKGSLSNIILFVLCLVLLSSCGSTFYLKEYKGPRLPNSEVAVIELKGCGLCSVDDKSWENMEQLTKFTPGSLFPSVYVEVTPGRRNISVWCNGGDWVGKDLGVCTGPYSFDLKAGHNYIIKCQIDIVSDDGKKRTGKLIWTIKDGDEKEIKFN